MITVNVTTFHSHYADANPKWVVREKRGRGTWIAEVIDCPDYSGVKRAFTTQEIEGSNRVAKFWNKLANEGEQFYANLVVGSIVHYNNGHNSFVRCKVMPDKQLLPIALVGSWASHELPHRMNDGSIYNGYQVDKIKEGKVFQPNASNIYEYTILQKKDSQPIGFNATIDPRNMTPLSFDVPAMTPEQEAKAALVRKVNNIQNICGNNDMTPDGKLDMIRNLLDDKAL